MLGWWYGLNESGEDHAYTCMMELRGTNFDEHFVIGEKYGEKYLKEN